VLVAGEISTSASQVKGPSVDQVFRSVSEDVSEDAAADLENEFLRLVEALL